MSRPARAISWALLALAASLPAASPAAAQSYAFSIPSAGMVADVKPDASAVLEYEIVFQNSPYGHPIDVVDVGLPHEGYDISNMRAEVDGVELTRIAASEYIDVGVEVHLGVHAIPPGETGTFRFQATMPDMVYNDTTDDALASFQITPTWFDSSLLNGTTDLRVAVALPEGVDPERVLHQDVPFDRKGDLNGKPVVGWQWEATRLDGPHRVGVSFPASSMERVVRVTKLDLLERWFEASPGVRLLTGLLTAILFGIFFFRFTGGTGWSAFILVLGVVGAIYGFNPALQLYTMPLWLVGGGLMEWRLQKGKRDYLPPLVHVEGGGIKRGLTAPEAAVLLELPLGRVVSLVLFGMLKKGLVRQTSADPLIVVIDPAYDTDSRGSRRKAASERGVVIHAYEHAFLDTIRQYRGLDVAETDFSDGVKALVERVAERVLGFDLDETRDYYRHIVQRAWREAKEVVGEEQRERTVDRNLEWLMMDDDWSDPFEDWNRSGWTYHPIWIRPGPSHSTVAPGSAIGAATEAASGAASGAPTFGDVSASFAGWTENVTGQLASMISPSSLQVDGGADAGGVINLSGADRVTGDVLSAFFSGSGGGGGGGGGGGCACACAGCACACACAGGGR